MSAGENGEVGDQPRSEGEGPLSPRSGLRPIHVESIAAIEKFLEIEKPGRGLVQLATGSGKNYIISDLCSRLLKSRQFHRILIIADTKNRVKNLTQSIENFSATHEEEAAGLLRVADLSNIEQSFQDGVVVATIQRLISLSKTPLDRENSKQADDDETQFDLLAELYDLVIVDETQGVTNGVARTVLKSFTGPIVGFTTSADPKALELFDENLLWRYTYEQAVRDGYSLDCDIYRLKVTINSNVRSKESSDGQVAPRTSDSIEDRSISKTILEHFRSKLFSDLFPGRTIVPKTLIFAKNNAHADEIVDVCRQVFKAEAGFAEKINSQTPNASDLVQKFSLTEMPRIVVTVNMLATGVDIPALECLVFMRDVRSEILYQQMLARGARTIDKTSLRMVTPDASEKTRFVVVDAVGVTEPGHFSQEMHVPRREQHLIEGRRVRVSDLLAAGLLTPGAYLRFKPRENGSVTTATISEGGEIILLDGREFRSPSAAASAVASYALDGWHAWVTEEDEATLDNLRQILLGSALDDLGLEKRESVFLQGGSLDGNGTSKGLDSEDDLDLKIKRLEELKQLRRAAEAGELKEMSVREFISLWGARGRDASLTGRIEADLANHGLITVPDFRVVTLEDRVAIKLAAAEQQPSKTAEVDTEEGPSPEVRETPRRGPRPERGLTVGNLYSANRGVEAVPLTATFEQVITKLLFFDYSQLAVMSGERKLHGAITWRSIAKVRYQNPESPLKAAIARATEVAYDDDLIDVLPKISEDEFVFVRGPENTISGIVTASDVLQSYGEMTSPFFVIGEIDQMLRWILEGAIDFDDVSSLCDADGKRGLNSFSQLSMGDYQRVLENPDAWGQLGWPLDRKIFAERLKKVCETRNNIMHFNGDSLPSDILDLLKNFLIVLRDYSAGDK